MFHSRTWSLFGDCKFLLPLTISLSGVEMIMILFSLAFSLINSNKRSGFSKCSITSTHIIRSKPCGISFSKFLESARSRTINLPSL